MNGRAALGMNGRAALGMNRRAGPWGREIPAFAGMTGGSAGMTGWVGVAAMMGSADCWRRERLEFLVPLSFPPISSCSGGASRASARTEVRDSVSPISPCSGGASRSPFDRLRTGSARTEVRDSVFAGDRLGELVGGAAGLERFLVTTCHGPLQNPGQSNVGWWQSLAWVPGSGAGLDLVPS